MGKLTLCVGGLTAAVTAGCYHSAVKTGVTPSADKTVTPAVSEAPQYVIDGVSPPAAAPTPAAGYYLLFDGKPLSLEAPSGGKAITPAPDATPQYFIDGMPVEPVPPATPHP